jgi:hypothetical protein
MSKPSISILVVALSVAIAFLALFARRNEDKDRTLAGSAGSTARLAPIATPVSLAGTGDAGEPPRPSAGAVVRAPLPGTAPDRDAGKRLDETSLLSRLHDLAASDPPRSLALAREAAARFPASSNAPEFEWNVVKALANMDRYPEAEAEARLMLQKFPGNAFADDVERHLLNHPPNPPSLPDR